ncbi:MAG: DNA polymerase III subunit beta [Desulfobacteraceae bacterium 4572_87]|nr:MAG: DNA polymerase III subunit beta [Desulfobacteraceae bacterium 4572_87]
MKLNPAQMNRIIELAKNYGAKRLILFGSYLTSPDKAQDLDLACDGILGWKLYEFCGLLENELRIQIDIVPLSPETRFTRLIEQRGKALI